MRATCLGSFSQLKLVNKYVKMYFVFRVIRRMIKVETASKSVLLSGENANRSKYLSRSQHF